MTPSNTLDITWRTSSTSKAVLIIINQTNQKGDQFWFWKPEQFTMILNAMVDDSPHPDKYVNEVLKNMSYAAKRDPKKGTNDQDERERLEKIEPKSKGGNIQWVGTGKCDPLYLCYSFFTIPVENFKNKEDEQEWIQLKCNAVGEYLIEMQTNDETFKELFKLTSITPKFADVALRSYRNQYYNKCTVSVDHCANVNSYFIREYVQKVMGVLLANDNEQKKYENRMVHDDDTREE